ncbi:MAG: helix-turn-helix domain-containing protein [Terrimicrobiaceae bacterium]
MSKSQSTTNAEEMGLGQTLGGVFAFARESKGIPLEQAAHETRIRIHCLRELESDDFSHLSPGYARLFIMDYARYLGIPADSIKDKLPEVGDFGTQGYEYIKNAPGPSTDAIRAPKARPKKSRVVLVAMAVILAGIGGFQGYTIWRKLDRIKTPQVTMSERRTLMSVPLPPPANTTPNAPSNQSAPGDTENQTPDVIEEIPDPSPEISTSLDRSFLGPLASGRTL